MLIQPAIAIDLNTTEMKILLIDDHVSFCEGLIATLTNIRKDYHVEFDADAELVPQTLLARSDYDLFIIDLMMPGLGGIELIKYLNKGRNHTPIMVMSSVLDVAVVQELLGLGIIGYLPKSYSASEIVAAIEGCREGKIHIPAFYSQKKPSQTPGSKEDEDFALSAPTVDGVTLTRRQIEIISLMDKGFSNQEMADTLFIAKTTVKTHVRHLFKIFNVTNRINCLHEAKKAGLHLSV